jgi:hypothetical protein
MRHKYAGRCLAFVSNESHEPFYGVNHIGFLVADVLKSVDDLSLGVDPNASPPAVCAWLAGGSDIPS